MAAAVTRVGPVCSKKNCSPFDTEGHTQLFTTRNLHVFPAGKYQYIDNIWKPDRLFNFPKSLETKAGIASKIPVAGLLKIFGWCILLVLIAVFLLWNGVWQEYFETTCIGFPSFNEIGMVKLNEG